MVFSDLFFLFVFLPAFALSYLAAHWIDQLLSSENSRPNRIVENAVLVVFSLIFYASVSDIILCCFRLYCQAADPAAAD
jgi:alginate O-acetyltransferase complex protein AlgI